MPEHMTIDEYRKETGTKGVELGGRMNVDQLRLHVSMDGQRVGTLNVRSSKYNAKRTEYGGRVFDSKAEEAFAESLDNMRAAADPRERVVLVQYQVPYDLNVNGQLICRYIADFVVEYGDGRTDVIDAKGVLTPIYKLKKKLMLAVHGISIKENL